MAEIIKGEKGARLGARPGCEMRRLCTAHVGPKAREPEHARRLAWGTAIRKALAIGKGKELDFAHGSDQFAALPPSRVL